MAVFVVIATVPSPALEASIQKHFPNDHQPLGLNSWLVAGSGIAKEISEKLTIVQNGIGNAVVFSISGYWGLANNSIWEWIALKSTTGVAKDAPSS
jgi:hypothetical protein